MSRQQLDEIPLVVPAAVCKDTKASLLVHLRDETLDFSGGTEITAVVVLGGLDICVTYPPSSGVGLARL